MTAPLIGGLPERSGGLDHCLVGSAVVVAIDHNIETTMVNMVPTNLKWLRSIDGLVEKFHASIFIDPNMPVTPYGQIRMGFIAD